MEEVNGIFAGLYGFSSVSITQVASSLNLKSSFVQKFINCTNEPT